MSYQHLYVHLFVEKKSTRIGKIKDMLPSDADLDYTFRRILYDKLKSYMDESERGDFIVILREKECYYKVYVESLGGDVYTIPSEFVDKIQDEYIEFKIDGCDLMLEYQIDDT